MITTESKSIDVLLVKRHSESLMAQREFKRKLEGIRDKEIMCAGVALALIVISIL